MPTKTNFSLSLRKRIVKPMKRIVILIVMLMALQANSFAVLKEKNLDETLQILRTELTNSYRELQHRSDISQQRSLQARQTLLSTLKRSEQNALMLYSQQSDYVFDLTYACNEATELWREFKKKSMPFDKIIINYNAEKERYERLVESLQDMPTMMLSKKAKMNRSVCLTLASAILNDIRENLASYQDDIQRNNYVRKRLDEQHQYAQERYDALQQSIFVNGEQSYLQILTNLSRNLKTATIAVVKKYLPKDTSKSQWSGKYILFLIIIIILYACGATAISMLMIRFIMPIVIKKSWWPTNITPAEFRKQQPYIVMASTAILFAIILAIVRFIANTQNFVVMASDLLIEFAWLMGIILVSLLIRIDAARIKNGFRVYLPIMIMGFAVITFRIILIPNIIVNIIFPPVLLGFAFWQWTEMRRHADDLNKEDRGYGWITLIVLVVSLVSSWVGYTLMAVQVLIWWIMQLACLLTITFFYKLLKRYGKARYDDTTPITKNWLYGLFRDVLLPSAGICSVMISIFFAADVFDLSDICWKMFQRDFIDFPNFKLSLWKLSEISSLLFLFKYISKLSKKALRYYFDNKADAGKRYANHAVLGANAINILVWGIYVLLSMSLLRVGNTWLTVVSGGLATGLGFASKDILENIYYGISLMAGRIHVGDTIEVDGIRGVVNDMNYTSTLLESADGSIIAFQNSQLFAKNYKNLTKNNGWELAVIPIGVAYGTNINQAKQVIVDACLQEIDELNANGNIWIDKTRGITVVFVDFGASSIDLNAMVWISVANKFAAQDAMRTAIYNALNEANIEIPFPQTDVHLHENLINKK